MKRSDRRRHGAPAMHRYRVVAWWPKQAAFDISVDAEDAKHARRLAEDTARGCGWVVSRPRKIDVIKVDREKRVAR